jgi:hypothetical protein
VQLAAAEAILNIPNVGAFPGSSRVVDVLRRALGSEGSAKAFVGAAVPTEGQRLAGLLRQIGYDASVITTGRELVRQANEVGGLALIFIDPNLPEPGLPYTLTQLRAGSATAGLPLILTPAEGQEKAARAAIERYRRAYVLSPVPVTSELLRLQLDPIVKETGMPPMTDAERHAHAQTALRLLLKINRGEVRGIDVRSADPGLYNVLAVDSLAAGAAEVLAYRPGKANQAALADVVLQPVRPPAVRAAVADALRAHVQRFGLLLPPTQLGALTKLPETAEDPALREQAARLAASLQPDASGEGSRLKRFSPGGAAPKGEPPPPKADEGKDKPAEDKDKPEEKKPG